MALSACQEAPKEEKTVVVQGNIEADTTWTADKNYVLDQQVTVPSGVTLTIEPGTVIKANAGEAPSVSMLVVARGGKIMAKGTAEAPIIFTSINDNLDKENNIASALNQEDVGLGEESSFLEMRPFHLLTVTRKHSM